MKLISKKNLDILIIEPEVYYDNRGYFFESFNQKSFNEVTGLDITFVQDNQSMSYKGVVRGLHYQLPPMTQGKLVRVLYGEVFDVAVDIRKSSPNFGKSVTTILSAKNNRQIWIPEGYAHGFVGLSNESILLYKTTNYYSPIHERIILYNDPSLEILWPKEITLDSSSKDKNGFYLKDAEIYLK